MTEVIKIEGERRSAKEILKDLHKLARNAEVYADIAKAHASALYVFAKQAESHEMLHHKNEIDRATRMADDALCVAIVLAAQYLETEEGIQEQDNFKETPKRDAYLWRCRSAYGTAQRAQESVKPYFVMF